jgi:ribosomal peptide maturation radical SAM protein 1
MSARPPHVALVSMPFAYLDTPSIGLSLLRGSLADSRVEVSIHYATLDFGRRVGREVYEAVATQPGMSFLAGEWLFAMQLLDAAERPDDAVYLGAIERGELGSPARHDLRRFFAQLAAARAHVEPFLEDWCERLLALKPAIVGFTSVFQQHLSSLALARRLKQRAPDIVTVLGGPACDDTLGVRTAREFPWLDAVVYGEADELFPQFVERALAGEDLSALAGVYTHAKARATEIAPGSCASTQPIADMERLPMPRYEDFLEQLRETGFAGELRPELLLETSRGCWWGEKHHCVFCGLNDVTMGYRHKSAARVLGELDYLQALAPEARITGTDAIFNMRYFADLIPALAERSQPPEIYFETKANIRDEHVRGFHAAGVRTIQPGIESFVTSVLRRMDKGVTAAQNVRLLRTCEEHGVLPAWNHLWGLPGEEPADYAVAAEQIPLLAHLQPPEWMGPIAILRFSPLQIDPRRFGIASLRHARVYDFVYPQLSHAAKEDLAYYFDPLLNAPADVEAYTRPLADAISAWRESNYGSILFWREADAVVTVWDTRPVACQPLIELRGAERAAFHAFHDPTARERALEQLAAEHGAAEALEAVEALEALGLLFADGERRVNVAVGVADYPLASAAPAIEFVRAQKLALLERVVELTSSHAASR